MADNYLLDFDFLKALDEYNQKEVYAKIISLDFNENPVVEIQGNVSQGSISIDGSSSVRRTCNLTLITNQVNVNETDWTLRSKFKVLIGLKNFINPKYDDIIWFKQGTFIITSFNSTQNGQGYSITIQGKDKMCLLNGDVGGNLFAAHDFGAIDIIQNDGARKRERLPIHEIIRELVHTYALESYANIIIEDLEGCSVELLQYTAKGCPMYIYNRPDSTDPAVIITQSGFANGGVEAKFEEIFVQLGGNENRPALLDGETVLIDQIEYTIIKRVDYGTTAGYRITDLVYPGDLIAAVGAAVTSVLDSIVSMLGEFEYFYDLDGRFIFRRKRIYYNIAWNNIINNKGEVYAENTAYSSSSIYEFNRGLLIESFANKPSINNIRNDFAVWGLRPGISTNIPIHLRYAIDQTPTRYYSYSKKKTYESTEIGGPYDWRELIYQMAVDNNIFHGKLDSIREQYTDAEIEEIYHKTWNTGYDAYYADMLGFWPTMYRTERTVYYKTNPDGTIMEDEEGNLIETEDSMSMEEWGDWQKNKYWNPNMIQAQENGTLKFVAPEILTFWIDFVDLSSYLGKYAPQVIGRRPKVVNDQDVKAIFFRETPEVLFLRPEEAVEYDDTLGYVKMNLPASHENYFSISSQGKSAKEVLDNLLYQHTYYQESITISTIPVYYLEPNHRISVVDEMSGIDGEYIIKSINISLAHDGMMSITATKAETRLL